MAIDHKRITDEYEVRRHTLIDELAKSGLSIEITAAIAVSNDMVLSFLRFRMWALLLIAANFAFDIYQAMR